MAGQFSLSIKFSLISFALILLLVPSSSLTCEEKKSCDECLGAEGCAWCKELKESEFPRCSTEAAHKSRRCPESEILRTFPNKLDNSRPNKPLSQTMRIHPQNVGAKLSVGQKDVEILLSYQDTAHKELDLYYIMDLSATMEDDKNTVHSQADGLVKGLEKLTSKVRLGFGSFIDKPLLPFVSSDQLRTNNGAGLQIPYGFKNELSLTSSVNSFKRAVKNAKLSQNLDEPEGTLDALMQAITCKEEIGWKNTSQKLIVVATDGSFHIAGDGKLGGVVKPNDLQCHMENHVYSHSKILDYPSIGEINAVILEHQVYVIFAVPVGDRQGDQTFSLYEQLARQISQSAAVKLEDKSTDLDSKIRDKYYDISSRVELRVLDAPSFIGYTIYAKCSQNGAYQLQKECKDVKTAQKIDFRVNLKLKECPDPLRHPDYLKKKVVISFFGLAESEKLTIDLSYGCTCPCTQVKDDDPNKLMRYCTGANVTRHLSCGMCACNPDRRGHACQCSNDGDENENSAKCRATETSAECENNGQCKCGRCDCNEGYNGQFCNFSTDPCRNKDMPNILCSGPNRGQCVRERCECTQNYEGEFCECDKSAKISCVEPGKAADKLCNDRGRCACNEANAHCECSPGYTGKYCEVCTGVCPSQDRFGSRCQEEILQSCVKCRVRHFKESSKCNEKCDWESYLAKKKAGKGTEEKKGEVELYDFFELTKQQTLSEFTGSTCEVMVNSTCKTTFKYAYHKGSSGDLLRVFFTPHEVVCDPKPPIIWYIIGVILGVLLLGIFSLLVWKLATYLHDTREYQKFENERSQAKWHGGQNPLFVEPKAEFQNPAYRE